MTTPRTISRRRLLVAGGLAMATLGGLARPAAAAPSARFDLTAPGTALFTEKPLPSATVMQSLAFDNVQRSLYVVQLIQGGVRLPGEDAPVSGATRALHGDLSLARLAVVGTTFPFQGYTSFGDFPYLLEGSGYGTSGSVPPTGNTHITCVDWATGAIVDRQLVTDGADLDYREPEGMAIQVPDVTRPERARLCFGFASGPTGARRANVFFKDALV
jgi:hypothetical protein